MTTNDATAREHVAMTILFVDRAKPDELIAANWEARKDRNSGLESQEELLRYADNAIAAHSEYLWQTADDPAVVEAVAKANYQEDWQETLEWEDEQGSPDVREWIEEASKWTRLVLTALIGPRPQGENE